MTSTTPLTVTELLAAATSVLIGGGYTSVSDRLSSAKSSFTRLFEDEYNVVALAVFPTCSELIQSWADLQGNLVETISHQVGRQEAKAWDGHLVLLTVGVAPSEDAEITAIKYDTGRLRKIVATGEELNSREDVERVLRPLLPLGLSSSYVGRKTALQLLPDLLNRNGIERQTTEKLLRAFLDQEPLLESLHRRNDL